MLLNLFAITMGVLNPRIIAFHVKHSKHEGKIRGKIDEGFNGRMFMQVTCEGCDTQKEYRLHGFKAVEDFVLDITGDKKK